MTDTVERVEQIDRTAALLPCPFCGGEASGAGRIRFSHPLADTWWDDGSEVTEAFYVNCIACGATPHSGLVGGCQAHAEAIAAWNRRAAIAVMPCAELERELQSLIEAIADWARPTGANGMISAGASHSLCVAADRARTALASHRSMTGGRDATR